MRNVAPWSVSSAKERKTCRVSAIGTPSRNGQFEMVGHEINELRNHETIMDDSWSRSDSTVINRARWPLF